MDTILRINVAAEGAARITAEPVGAYAGLGGRAMTSAVICREVPPDCHPLGAENKLVIAPGLMSGSMASTSGRLSVGCKSPLTGGIKEANSGGTGAQALARLGYAAVILEGERPAGDDWHKLVISAQGATLVKDNSLRLLTNYDLVERIKAEHGDSVTVLSIGPAGERRMANSTIAVTDVEMRPTRHAGRGGVGAVMGSKGIKCIVVDAQGTKARQPANPEAFKAANKAFVEGLRTHAVTGQGLPAYGTNVLTNVLCEAGATPPIISRKGASRARTRSPARPRPPWKWPGAGWPPTAATGAAPSSARASTTTRTATSSPSSPSTRRSGRMAATAASTTWTSSPGWTSWTTPTAWTPSRWA